VIKEKSMRRLVAIATLALFASGAGAAEVTLSLEPAGGNTFDLYMEVTNTSGSYGISSFSVFITGGSFTSNLSPYPYFYQATPPFTGEYAGYEVLRQETAANVAGAQDKIGANSTNIALMFGVGQSTVNWSQHANYDPDMPSGFSVYHEQNGITTSPSKVKIGTGTEASPAWFDMAKLTSGDMYVTVFTTGSAQGTATPTTNADLVFVPEPVTVSLLALGGLALIRRRRR
jgi:hypothetical protein